MNRLGLELNLTFSCAINLANAVVALSLSLFLSLPPLVSVFPLRLVRRLPFALSLCLLFTCFLSFFILYLMSFTSSAFFSLFSGLLWLLLLCVISHVSHALCISRYLMPLFTLFPLSPSRVLFSARVLQLYSIYSKSNGFFLPALTSFSSFSILFYFISTVCVFLSVCVCAVIESHFNGRRFSRQFSLCCS